MLTQTDIDGTLKRPAGRKPHRARLYEALRHHVHVTRGKDTRACDQAQGVREAVQNAQVESCKP